MESVRHYNPDSSKRRFFERMQYVVAYLRGNKMPPDVANRILSFYRRQNVNQFDEKDVLGNLPKQLRVEIFDSLYIQVIQSNPLFRDSPRSFLTEVCLRLTPISFPAQQPIYQEGEHGEVGTRCKLDPSA